MHIHIYKAIDDFLLKMQPVLVQNEIKNSLLLGIGLDVQRSPERFNAPFLATVENEQGTVVASVMTPPFNIILYSDRNDRQAALELLAQELHQSGRSVPGVIAPDQLAEEFAKIWEALTTQKYMVIARQRLFKLNAVISPVARAGVLRLATPEDAEIIADWIAGFFVETLPGRPHEDFHQMAARRIATHEIYVWADENKKLCSMAATARAIVHTITIGPVYTPPEYRGMGYASNCVAALSQHLLDSGRQSCNLFTDLANPISNRIYQKIGYQPVCDYNEYVFNR